MKGTPAAGPGFSLICAAGIVGHPSSIIAISCATAHYQPHVGAFKWVQGCVSPAMLEYVYPVINKVSSSLH